MTRRRGLRASCGLALLVGALVATTACAPQQPVPATPPADLIGRFADDYGNGYEVTDSTWAQLPDMRHRIVRWDVKDQYILAQNAPDHPRNPGLWTRIDWVMLEGMPPYRWGYCYSTWTAASAAVAETVSVARRDTPRTGCNGFPFSRMKPAAAPPG